MLASSDPHPTAARKSTVTLKSKAGPNLVYVPKMPPHSKSDPVKSESDAIDMDPSATQDVPGVISNAAVPPAANQPPKFHCRSCDDAFGSKELFDQHTCDKVSRAAALGLPEPPDLTLQAASSITQNSTEQSPAKTPPAKNGERIRRDRRGQCPHCEKVLSREEHLTRHIQTVHQGLKPFYCEVCKNRFGRKDEYIRHQRMHERRGDLVGTNVPTPPPRQNRPAASTQSAPARNATSNNETASLRKIAQSAPRLLEERMDDVDVANQGTAWRKRKSASIDEESDQDRSSPVIEDPAVDAKPASYFKCLVCMRTFLRRKDVVEHTCQPGVPHQDPTTLPQVEQAPSIIQSKQEHLVSTPLPPVASMFHSSVNPPPFHQPSYPPMQSHVQQPPYYPDPTYYNAPPPTEHQNQPPSAPYYNQHPPPQALSHPSDPRYYDYRDPRSHYETSYYQHGGRDYVPTHPPSSSFQAYPPEPAHQSQQMHSKYDSRPMHPSDPTYPREYSATQPQPAHHAYPPHPQHPSRPMYASNHSFADPPPLPPLPPIQYPPSMARTRSWKDVVADNEQEQRPVDVPKKTYLQNPLQPRERVPPPHTS